MKLAIFGGTGRAGRVLLSRALADGHSVRAFVRDANRLTLSHPQLAVVEGRLDDGANVVRTIEGTDAVLSTLSAGRGVLTHFADAAIPYMSANCPRRVIALVGASLAMPGDPPTFSLRLMSAMMRLIPGHMLDDARVLADRLAASQLAWTLVRSASFTDRPATGKVRSASSFDMRLNAQIAVPDLASFMLELATANWYAATAPMVENA